MLRFAAHPGLSPVPGPDIMETPCNSTILTTAGLKAPGWRGGCSGRRQLCAAGLLLLAFATQGCIHRRVTIRTDPPGALVLLEGEELGYTPFSFDFTYYGTRELTLVKDGYETLTVLQKVRKPWYQRFPLEFVTDNFSVVKLNDRHEFMYRMRPQVLVPTQELLDRASGLRNEAQIPQ